MGKIIIIKGETINRDVFIHILCFDCYISHLLDLFSTKQFKRRFSHRFWIYIVERFLLKKLNFPNCGCAVDVNLVHGTAAALYLVWPFIIHSLLNRYRKKSSVKSSFSFIRSMDQRQTQKCTEQKECTKMPANSID